MLTTIVKFYDGNDANQTETRCMCIILTTKHNNFVDHRFFCAIRLGISASKKVVKKITMVAIYVHIQTKTIQLI